MPLSDAWEEQASSWILWARTPGHDSYSKFHRDQFLTLVPAPGRLSVDIGCGEGRLSRHLTALGHNVIGIDSSPTLIASARQADPRGEYLCASATNLPLTDQSSDLVIAFMSLQDIDHLPAATSEIARVLVDGGIACIAVVHPLNSAGRFTDESAGSPFVIANTYLDEFLYADDVSKDGLQMVFHSCHRPIEAYSRALEEAAFLIEAIREHRVPDHAVKRESSKRRQRIPLFLHIRAVRRRRPSGPYTVTPPSDVG